MRAGYLPRLRRLGLWLTLAALPVLSGCSTTARLEEVLAQSRGLAQSSKIYSADGALITTLHAEENREVVPLTRVPLHVRQAVVAAEDARFYRHAGVDLRAVARALLTNAAEGRVVEGGSTITQQYVRTVLIGRERTLKRKLREASLALQLERRYSKDEILERYLNTVYFGQGAYGIETAARTYFGKHAGALTMVEGALLAGLIKAPARLDPFADPSAARARRNVVLHRMREEGFITLRREAVVRRAPLGVRRRPAVRRYPAAYFVEYVKDLIQRDPRFRRLGGTVAERVNALFKGGLRIHTTVDLRLQRVAEEASRGVLVSAKDPSNAFVALDPKDGAVVAMVGGRDFFDPDDPFAKFNLAVQSRRQPGSSFKTFTLVGAIERGIPLERTYRAGSSIRIPLPGGDVWRVRNYENTSFGSRLSLRGATAYSVNVVYAQVVAEIGPAKVVEVARRMGITSTLAPYYSIALGTEEVSPLEMAAAYAPLANGGLHVQPTAIRKITDAAGRVLYEAEPSRERVLAPATVAVANGALRDVLRYGTGRRLQIGRPAAGKTGTTEEYADAWFAGYSPQLVGVSWVGFPRAQIPMRPPRTRITVVGGSWPGQVWKRFMLEAHRDLPVREFPYPPESLVDLRIDVTRDCVANRFTPPTLVRVQTFVRGQEPPVCTEPATPDIAAVPDVVGKPGDEARAALERAGFVVEARPRYCPAFQQGVVCAQSPAPGSAARVGDSAVVFVSDDAARAEVPMVLGRTEQEARRVLEDAGFEVAVAARSNVEGYRGCRDPGEARPRRVWLQDPCAGAVVGAGIPVTLLVNPDERPEG